MVGNPPGINENVADVWPAGIVTDPGGLASALFEASDTTAPLEGAGPLRVSVPVTAFPPNKETGVKERLVSPRGRLMVKFACTVFPA